MSRIRSKAILILVTACAVTIGAGLATYLVQVTDETDSTKTFATELRNGLVASCEKNGNPLREAVQHQIQREIRQRETVDYSRFFPDVPPAELQLLLDEQTAADRATLREIAPVNCEQLYPKP